MKRVLSGTVVSTKMHKTVVVAVSKKTPHPLYKKLLTKTKKYLVDTKDFTVTPGNMVKIAEIRPISKHKHFVIQEVLSKKESAA